MRRDVPQAALFLFATLLLRPASPLLPYGDIRHCSGDCSGKVRHSLAFEGGSSAGFPIAHSDILASGGTKTFSFELWIRYRNCSTPSCNAVELWGNSAQGNSSLQFTIELQATDLGARVVLLHGVLGRFRMNTSIHVDSWVHAAFTYAERNTTLFGAIYINGQERSTKAAPSNCSACINPNSTNVVAECNLCFLPFAMPLIGNSYFQPFLKHKILLGGSFVGMLSEVRMWSSARSSAQMLSFWDQTFDPKLSLALLPNDLVGYWLLDQNLPGSTYIIPDARLRTYGIMFVLHGNTYLWNSTWPNAWRPSAPGLSAVASQQEIQQVWTLPRSGPVNGGTKIRILFRRLFDNSSHWGSRILPVKPSEEPSNVEKQVSVNPESRRLREPFECHTLEGPDDRRPGHQLGGGGGLADYSALASGDIFNTGEQNAIAGHQNPGALDIWNSTGHPVDTTMKLRRFQALREAHVSSSLILTADFDQNGHLDIMVFGSRNILFLQMPSCPTCAPYFGEGDLFVKHVPKLSELTRFSEQQPECVECIRAPTLPTGTGVQGVVADVNNDGFPDLIVGKARNSSSFKLLLNNGGTSFTDSGLTNFPQVDDIIKVIVGDLRSDQNFRKDIVFVGHSGLSHVYSTNYSASKLAWKLSNLDRFQLQPEVGKIALARSISHHQASDAVIGDFNGDGYTDIVFVSSEQDGHQIFLSTSNASWGHSMLHSGISDFQFTGQNIGTTPGAGILIADVDKDGDLDIYAVADSGIYDFVWINNGFGWFTSDTQFGEYGNWNDRQKYRMASGVPSQELWAQDYAKYYQQSFEAAQTWDYSSIVDPSSPIIRNRTLVGSVTGSNNLIWSIANISNFPLTKPYFNAEAPVLTPGSRVRLCHSWFSPMAMSLRYGYGDVLGDGGLGGLISNGQDGHTQDQQDAQNQSGNVLWTHPRSLTFADDQITFQDVIPGLPDNINREWKARVNRMTGDWWSTEAVDFETTPAKRSGLSRLMLYVNGLEGYMGQSVRDLSFSFYSEPVFSHMSPDKIPGYQTHVTTVTIHGQNFHNPADATTFVLEEEATNNTNQHSLHHLDNYLEELAYPATITVRFNLTKSSSHISQLIYYHTATYVSNEKITVVPPFHMLVNWNLTATVEVSFNQQNYQQVPGLLQYTFPQHSFLEARIVECSTPTNASVRGSHYYDTGEITVSLTPLDPSYSKILVQGIYKSSTEIQFVMPKRNIEGLVWFGFHVQVAFNSTGGLPGGEFQDVPGHKFYCYNETILPLVPWRPVLHWPNLSWNGPFFTHVLLENKTQFHERYYREGYGESFNAAKGKYKRSPFAIGRVSIGNFHGQVKLGTTEFCRYQNTTSNINYLHSSLHQYPRAIAPAPEKLKLTAQVNHQDALTATVHGFTSTSTQPQAWSTDFRVVGCFQVPRTPLVATGLRNGYLLKQNETGGTVWAVRFGGSANTTAKSILVTRDRTLFLAFHATGTVTLDEKAITTGEATNQHHPSDEHGTGSPYSVNRKISVVDTFRRAHTLPSTQSSKEFRKIVFSRYDRFGKFLLAREAAACYQDTCDFDSIQFDRHENIYMIGKFTGTISFGVRCLTNNTQTEKLCEPSFLDAEETRDSQVIMSKSSACTPNGLKSSANAHQNFSPNSDHNEKCSSVPLVTIQARAHARPGDLCQYVKGKRPVCTEDIFISMFDRNGTLFWVKNINTHALWMRHTPLYDYYTGTIDDWQEATIEFYQNTFRKILRPESPDSLLSALRDDFADLPETYNSLSLAYFQEFHKFDYAPWIQRLPGQIRQAVKLATFDVHQTFNNIKDAANQPCCALACRTVTCSANLTAQLLRTLRVEAADITESSSLLRYGDALSASIVRSGSKVAYMRQLFSKHKYDFSYVYFNTEAIRAIVKGVNNFVDSVNDVASEDLKNFRRTDDGPGDTRVTALITTLSSNEASLLRDSNHLSLLPTSLNLLNVMNPNLVQSQPSPWTQRTPSQLLHSIRLAKSSNPGACCPIFRRIDMNLTHQQIDTVLSAQGPLIDEWPTNPSSLHMNQARKLWFAVTVFGTQFVPFDIKARLLLLNSFKSFSGDGAPTQFHSVIIPLLIDNALNSSATQLISLDHRRHVLNVTMPFVDPSLFIPAKFNQGGDPLFNQPSKIEPLFKYKLSTMETVVMSIPAELVEDKETNYNNTVAFSIRPVPIGTVLTYQPDPQTTLLPGVFEDEIRNTNKTLIVYLAVDRFRHLDTILKDDFWPYSEYQVFDAMINQGLTSDMGANSSFERLVKPRLSQWRGNMSLSTDLREVHITFPGVRNYSVEDREILTVSIPGVVTYQHTEYSKISEFMIRRASPTGTAVVPMRSNAVSYPNWGVAELDEFSIQSSHKYIDFRMAVNKFKNFGDPERWMIVEALKSTISHSYYAGFLYKVLPKIEQGLNSPDQHVRAAILTMEDDNSTLRVNLPLFSEFDLWYDIVYPETFSLTIPGSMTTLGTDHPFRPIILRPKPGGTLLQGKLGGTKRELHAYRVTERHVREGGKTFILEMGGVVPAGHTTFKELKAAVKVSILSRIVAATWDKQQTRGWNAVVAPILMHPLWRRIELYNADRLKATIELPKCDGIVAAGSTVPNELYDITEPETITIYVPGDSLESGIDQPYASFIIQPDPLGTLLSATPNQTALGSRGDTTLQIWLGHDKFVSDDEAVILSMFGTWKHPWVYETHDQPHGFNTEIRPKLLANWSTYATVNEARNGISMHLPASNFSIDYPEELRIDIPSEAVESGTGYHGSVQDGTGYGIPGFFRFYLPAFPKGSLFSSPGIASAARIREGGGYIVFKVSPYRSNNMQNQHYQQLESYSDYARITAGFSSDSSFAEGFEAIVLNDWQNAQADAIYDTRSTTSLNTLDTLTIGPLAPYPNYRIPQAERIRFRITDGVLADGSGTPVFSDFIIEP